jgi:hypothetical protein
MEEIELYINLIRWKAMHSGIARQSDYVIREIISQYHIPQVLRVAVSYELYPLVIYGIAGSYENGVVQHYFIRDEGEIIPVALDFFLNRRVGVDALGVWFQGMRV